MPTACDRRCAANAGFTPPNLTLNSITTEAQREKAAAIAAEMSTLPAVEAAQVDDWDDFGSFNFFVRLKTVEPTSSLIKFPVHLQSIILKLKAIVGKHGAVWQWHQPPQRLYGWAGRGKRKYWNGYDTNSYKLSVRVPSP
jgi:hypothetical protein